MSKDQYEDIYQGAGKGDTWSGSEDMANNPRMGMVSHVREGFPDPISVLDIGTGKGVNTKWIAESGDGSKWTGVDFIKAESLEMPEGDEHFTFHEGDFMDDDFREANPDLQEQKDLIVDQGAVLVELEGADLVKYLELVSERLSDEGKFVTLLLRGESNKAITLVDGRTRVTHEPEDLGKPPFSDYFEVDRESLENPMLYGYSYLAEDEARPGIKNPYGARIGDEDQVTVFQTILKKKPKG